MKELLFEIKNSYGEIPYNYPIDILYARTPNTLWFHKGIKFRDAENCLRIKEKNKDKETICYLIDIEDFILHFKKDYFNHHENMKETIILQFTTTIYTTIDKETLITFIKNNKLIIGVCITITNSQKYGNEITYVREILYSELKRVGEQQFQQFITNNLENAKEGKLACEFGATDIGRESGYNLNNKFLNSIKEVKKFLLTLKI